MVYWGMERIKSALGSVRIGSISKEILSKTRFFSLRLLELGNWPSKRTEMANRFERLAIAVSKESKILKSKEEAMEFLSKLNESELKKITDSLKNHKNT